MGSSLQTEVAGSQIIYHAIALEGLKILQKKIEQLLLSTQADHTHLISEDWGGDDITTEKQSATSTLIQSVKIFKWD